MVHANPVDDGDELKRRVATAAEQIIQRQNPDEADSASGLVALAMQGFHEHGLLALDFLKPGSGPADGGYFDPVSVNDVRRAVTVIQTLAAWSGTLASIYMVNVVLGGAVIAMSGTREQQGRLLDGLRSARLEVAFAMTEPDAGSDAAAMRTAVRREGSALIMDGEKLYATGALSADMLLVVARSPGDASEGRAFGLFLVPTSAAGVSIEPLEKLSADAHASCRVRLDGVRLDADAILGGERNIDGAWSTLRRSGALERLIMASMATGLGHAVLERSITFARDRRQFGRHLTEFQSIQHRLVDMRVALEGMRLFVQQALSAVEAGGDPTEAICMAKLHCADQLQGLVGSGMRILGGRAYFDFESMSRYYREAPFSLYAGGTLEVQKMLIARAMGLGRP
ncbi:MAG: acyl-CoA dehydrogenase [Ectothiorhodospiraceae bacterium]|nr:acyl-CoA dehydrogenase [Ectothiorhodospiraceae bacterium]